MQASTRPGKAKFRVLYLGSDLELISTLKEQQEETGYQLVSCSDVESATLFLESEIPYQLLLIDFDWRGGEGLQVAQVARSLRHRKRMPVILVAAKRLTSRQKALARKAGIGEYTRKDAVGEIVGRLIES